MRIYVCLCRYKLKMNLYSTTLLVWYAVRSVVGKQSTKRLAVVRATDSLGQDLRDVEDVKLVAQAGLVLILRHTVGGH